MSHVHIITENVALPFFFDLLTYFGGVEARSWRKSMEISKQLVLFGPVGFEDGIRIVNLVVSTSPAELLSLAPLVKLC